MSVIESIVGDVRHAVRQLARRPGFAAAAVLTISVGMGTPRSASPRGVQAAVSGIDLDSPLIYVLIAMLLTAIAVAAAAVPGRRAARVDPLAALRME